MEGNTCVRLVRYRSVYYLLYNCIDKSCALKGSSRVFSRCRLSCSDTAVSMPNIRMIAFFLSWE